MTSALRAFKIITVYNSSTPSVDIRTPPPSSMKRFLDETGPPSPIDIDTPDEDQEEQQEKKKRKKKKRREEAQEDSQHLQTDVNKDKTKRKRREEDEVSEVLERETKRTKGGDEMRRHKEETQGGDGRRRRLAFLAGSVNLTSIHVHIFHPSPTLCKHCPPKNSEDDDRKVNTQALCP